MKDSTPAGVLLVDKPAGMTSTDVVRRARKVFRTRRVGHAGTLDPDATGVLVVCIGEATKAVPFLMADEKVYTSIGQFGRETWTDDADGDIHREAPFEHVTREQVDAALDELASCGTQVPPRVSAIKRDGERMYDRARRGEDVEVLLEPRPVDIRAVRVLRFELPEFELEMVVGKGFYVRSLVRDLGRAVSSAAHVRSLRRVRSGPFDVGRTCSVDDIGPETLLTLGEALQHLPPVILDDDGTRRMKFGQRLVVGRDVTVPDGVTEGQPLRALSPNDELIAITAIESGTLRVVRGFGQR